MTDMEHMKYLRAVADEDVAVLTRKEATYQGSWKKRGGVGAFMMLARKWDRLEYMAETFEHKYDIFECISVTGGHMQGEDGTILAEIRDLRRYLLLVEAEMVARGVALLSTPREIAREIQEYQDSAGKKVLSNMRRVPRFEGPGTPEDGGHHAGQQRLDDGVPAEEISPSDHKRLYFRPTGGSGLLVNRAALSEDQWEHLPRLRSELNNKEYSELQHYYRCLYRWFENDAKWMMIPEYREYWEVAP